ncbi:MAG TPA: tRNA pseudouridine(13) synthase TruD [Luteimonas sp.]|nr:tRNA pseudouridine(13) synthase TruD [Luteimonas sp.]
MSVLPRAHGAAVLTARMRSTPEDFVVAEIDAFAPTGTGEHLLLTVEKRGMNTAFAASRIAQWAGVPEMAIGYAGLKDRHAVTRQRFSVHLPKRVAPDIAALESPDLRVLASSWHAKKLPRGALGGNRFELVLREIDGERSAIDARLRAIADRGVPNYFGEQRFGRGGDNVAGALAMFAGRRMRREQRTMLLSAARSELFNRVLAARVDAGCWDIGLDGEVWMLDGSRSVFGPESWTPDLQARLAAFDIHPTGPLWGRGVTRATGDALALETAALSDGDGPDLQSGLEAAGLKQERRANRLRPGPLRWEWRDGPALWLGFDLPAGCYATTVLHALGTVLDRSSESSLRH